MNFDPLICLVSSTSTEFISFSLTKLIVEDVVLWQTYPNPLQSNPAYLAVK